MKTAHFEVMQADALNKEIKAIAGIGNKLNKRIQFAALNAIHYSIAHGDVGFGQRLVMAMNNGLRKNSLVAFLEKHGKFQWAKEQKSLIYKKRDELQAADATAICEKISEMWFDTIKAPEPQSMYDFDASFDKFMKNAAKAAANESIVFKGGEHMSKMLALWAELQAEVEDDEQSEEVSDSDVTNDGTFTAEEVAETAALMAENVGNNRGELRAA